MNSSTAIYIRISIDAPPIESQERELMRYCKVRGWSHTTTYTDNVSGAKATPPSLDRLLNDIRGGKIQRVVCYKLDRLGRSLSHLALILEELNRLKIPLICTSQGIDTSDDNPVGKSQLGVLMAVAESERGIIKERVNAGLAAAKARGVRLGRPATLQKRSKEVLTWRKRGLGVRAIARKSKLPVSSVHSILKSHGAVLVIKVKKNS